MILEKKTNSMLILETYNLSHEFRTNLIEGKP